MGLWSLFLWTLECKHSALRAEPKLVLFSGRYDLHGRQGEFWPADSWLIPRASDTWDTKNSSSRPTWCKFRRMEGRWEGSCYIHSQPGCLTQTSCWDVDSACLIKLKKNSRLKTLLDVPIRNAHILWGKHANVNILVSHNKDINVHFKGWMPTLPKGGLGPKKWMLKLCVHLVYLGLRETGSCVSLKGWLSHQL